MRIYGRAELPLYLFPKSMGGPCTGVDEGNTGEGGYIILRAKSDLGATDE